MACAVLPTSASFASNVIGYADCQAETIGQAGYAALTASGALVPSLLATLLTILVALVGYRLILGDTPSLREALLTIVRIGVVLAFATGWAAYRPVVYDVALQAPAELAARIGGASGLPGGDGLAAHLDAVDAQFQELAIENATRPAIATQPGAAAPLPFANFDVFALGSGRILFLVGALASYAAPKLLAGLLLALGPLFIAFLLFDATRGLAEAWIAALAGAALASLTAAIVLGVELAFLEPWLADLIVRRIDSEAITGLPSELLVLVLVFDLVLLVAGIGAAFTAVRLRVRFGQPTSSVQARSLVTTTVGSQPQLAPARPIGITVERSRAAAIAEATATLQRRDAERTATTSPGPAAARIAGLAATGVAGDGAARGAAATRRRTLPRRSNSAARRDRRS